MVHSKVIHGAFKSDQSNRILRDQSNSDSYIQNLYIQFSLFSMINQYFNR